jgi:hypothetical protein
VARRSGGPAAIDALPLQLYPPEILQQQRAELVQNF